MTSRKKKALWQCSNCGGPVVLTGGPGRTYSVRRGVELAIPDDFETPMCRTCGETSGIPEISDRLDELMSKKYLDQQREEIAALVRQLKERHQVSQIEIEDACRVTRSYLSHLLKAKEASGTLMQLLRSFVISPEAFLAACGKSEPVAPAPKDATVVSLLGWKAWKGRTTAAANYRAANYEDAAGPNEYQACGGFT